MKSKIPIVAAGLALAGIIAVQLYLISGLYNLRKNAFDTEYGKAVTNGLIEMQERYHTNGLDSAFYLIDVEAYTQLNRFESAVDDSLLSGLKQIILSRIYTVLVNNERITPFLMAYLSVNRLDEDFNKGILIRELVLLDHSRKIKIIDDKDESVTEALVAAQRKDALLVNTYSAEGNFFRIQLDYYIDFTRKTRIIFGEMVGALILALLSILVTGMVFLFTLRNMLRHRQLSLMKTDFINNMAHELKTPLTTISVASSTLADPDVINNPQKIGELTTLIRQQNQHLGRLIDHILDINLWEQDQITLHKSEVKGENMLRKSANAFRLENKELSFKLTEEIFIEGITIWLDEFQFSIVLHNLLANALKYGGDPPEIQLSAKLEGGHLVIRINDNGAGISKEEQKYIFIKFYRGKLVQKQIKGLGLGLFYVRKIVEMHGGTVEVESRPGKGSSFIIRLPEL